MADAPSSDWFVAYLAVGAPGTARNHQVAGQAAKPAVITMAFTQHQPSAAIFGVHMVMANPGDRPSNLMVTSQMPASVHSLANVTRKPNGNVDAVILHYKAINAELETQLAVACAQRDAYRELVEYCWRLVDAERKRLFK